jgi:hypothetical protein
MKRSTRKTARDVPVTGTRLAGLMFGMALLTGAVQAASSYLDNGVVKVGVDLSKGGSITYLSLSGTSDNIINNADLGRQIQQSYYSGPQPYNPSNNMNPNWTNWPWNPIQTGDSYGNPSQILAQTNTGNMLYVKCRPMQWALKNVPGECSFESWITLAGKIVTVSNRLLNARIDTNQYSAYNQELPAVYTIGRLYRLFSYAGNAPFTGGTLTNFPITPPPWVSWRATEHWAALVDATNWGLGVYLPGVVQFGGGFFGTPGSGGPTSAQTGYMAPNYTDILDGNITYTYTYQLIVGTLTEIRDWVYAQTYRPGCNYVFQSDRQHWRYGNVSDTGWPLTNNRVRVSLASSDPMMLSPLSAFYATNAPKLYIRAAYHIANPAGRGTGQLFWETNNQGGMVEARSVSFPIFTDGQFHTYELNPGANSNYTGLITQLRFDPAIGGDIGDYVDLAAISSSPAAGLLTTNLILNGDFSANAAAFSASPGYAGSGSNPTDITNWTNINGGSAGVNGAGVSFAPVNPFGPTNAGTRTYAFIQGGTNGLRQSVPLMPNTMYLLEYDLAARAGDAVNSLVRVGDNTQTYFTSGNVPANNVAFVHYSRTLNTPSVLDGNPVIELWNQTAGDTAIDFANISLVLLWALPNQPPSFTKGANQTVLEDSGSRTVAGWASAISPGPANESWQLVSFVCSNSNAGLFSTPPIVGTNGTLTFTTATNANGTTTVTVWAVDNGGTADAGLDTSVPQTFTITVTPVNDAPSFTKGPDVTCAEDAGKQTFPNWASNFNRGAPDESGQSVGFTVTNSNGALFSGTPAINNSGTLTFTPATNAFGIASVGVRMIDGGGTANGGVNTSGWQTFLITINPVNDAPVAASDALFAHWNTTSGFSISNLVANDVDPDGDALTVTAVTPGANTASVDLAADAVLYTPVAGFAGNAAFTYRLNDGQGGLATGLVSVVVVKPVITAWALSSNQIFHLNFQAIPNTSYRLQATTNFTTWFDLSTNTTGEDGRLQYDEMTQPSSGIRFYRFVWP